MPELPNADDEQNPNENIPPQDNTGDDLPPENPKLVRGLGKYKEQIRPPIEPNPEENSDPMPNAP